MLTKQNKIRLKPFYVTKNESILDTLTGHTKI